MNKSDLAKLLVKSDSMLSKNDIEDSLNFILNHLSETLSNRNRVEVRSFGSFSVRERKGRVGRNPKTGTPVALSGKYVPHFKPGKELRDRVNSSILQQIL